MEPSLHKAQEWPHRPCSAEQAEVFACHQPLAGAPIDTVPLAIREAVPALDVNQGQKYFADMELLDTAAVSGGAGEAGGSLALIIALIVAGGVLGVAYTRLAGLSQDQTRLRTFLGLGGILALLLVPLAFGFATMQSVGLVSTLMLLALGGAAYLSVRELLGARRRTSVLMLSATAVLTLGSLPSISGLGLGSLIVAFIVLGLCVAAFWYADLSTDVLPKTRARRWSLMILLAGGVLFLLGGHVFLSQGKGASAIVLAPQVWQVRLGGLMALVMGIDLIGYGLWMLRGAPKQGSLGLRASPLSQTVVGIGLVLSILWAWVVGSLIPLVFVILTTCWVLFLLLSRRGVADLPLIGLVSLTSLGKGALGLGLATQILPLAGIGAFFAFAGLDLIGRERQRRRLTWGQLIQPPLGPRTSL